MARRKGSFPHNSEILIFSAETGKPDQFSVLIRDREHWDCYTVGVDPKQINELSGVFTRVPEGLGKRLDLRSLPRVVLLAVRDLQTSYSTTQGPAQGVRMLGKEGE